MFWRISMAWGICLAVTAQTIIGGGDFLHNYNFKNGLKIDQTLWGYALFPQRLPVDGSRYIMTSFNSGGRGVNALTFRFLRRIYPVAPQTAGLDPEKRYAANLLNFTLSTHRPGKSAPGIERLCTAGERLKAVVRGGKDDGTESGTIYFSNLKNCTNLFRISEEKIVLYPRDGVITFERDGRREIRSLENIPSYGYYGFSGQGGAENFIVCEFTDITFWNRLDPAPTRLDNNYFRYIYSGYRDDGRLSVPETAYWRGRCLYDGGYGVERNFPGAVAEFQKSAAAGHVFGIYYLALCHYFGVGTPRSEEQAVALLQTAAGFQYDAAMTLYGILSGDRNMLMKSAAQGNAEALWRIGALEKAADRGHVKALYQLGLSALEAERDIGAARNIFTQMLESRFAPGIVKLAELTADSKRAYELYAQAARLGDPDGMFNAAWLLYRNQDGKREETLAKAREYIDSGVARNDARCKVALALFSEDARVGAELFFSGSREPALEQWRAGAAPYGNYAAGICYQYGFGVDEDRRTGRALLEAAFAAGVTEAGYELGRLLEADGQDEPAVQAYEKSELPQSRLALAGLLRKRQAAPERVAALLASAARDGDLEAMRLYAGYLSTVTPRNFTEASLWWGRYLDARIEQDNNSADGPYWRELPCCLPVEMRNSMPVDYESDLDDPARIRTFYQKYGN